MSKTLEIKGLGFKKYIKKTIKNEEIFLAPSKMDQTENIQQSQFYS